MSDSLGSEARPELERQVEQVDEQEDGNAVMTTPAIIVSIHRVSADPAPDTTNETNVAMINPSGRTVVAKMRIDTVIQKGPRTA
ncbi:MAG: hypothetical protein ACJ8EJ_06725 [Xanthobacteraceae bacterium]